LSIKFKYFFDSITSTLTYIVYDESSKDAVIIDPVMNLNWAAGEISYESVELVENFIEVNNLNAQYILETHIHADHLSGSAELKKRLPGLKIAIGENVTKVQEHFSKVFNVENVDTKGSQFDHLFQDGESFKVGSIEIKVISTPGHTPACCSFLIVDNLFVGDVIFMPDSGTGRCDFPGASAKEMYHSIDKKLYQLPDDTKVFVGHDYQPNGRVLKFETTIMDQKKNNIHLRAETKEDEFVGFRKSRDVTLRPPKLLLPSIQINMNGGNLPEAEGNGVSYLKVPCTY